MINFRNLAQFVQIPDDASFLVVAIVQKPRREIFEFWSERSRQRAPQAILRRCLAGIVQIELSAEVCIFFANVCSTFCRASARVCFVRQFGSDNNFSGTLSFLQAELALHLG